MPATLSALVFLVSIAGNAAVRDEGEGAESSELQLDLEGGDFLESTTYHSAAAVVTATGALHGASHGGGNHICCILFKPNGKRTSAQMHVYHESATKEIKKCHMTMITSKEECNDQMSCITDCKTKLAANRQYNLKMQEELRAREADEAAAIVALRDEGQKSHDDRVGELDAVYKKQLQVAEEDIQEAEQALNADKARLEELKQKLEEIKAEIASLPAKIETKTEHFKKSKETFYKVKEKALDEFEKGKELAAQQLNETLAEAERRSTELSNKTLEREAHFNTLKDQPVPAQCKGDTAKNDPYAAERCCCSIHGVPMLVDQTFTDWDTCLSPQKYKRRTIFAWSCKPFQECPRCREMVCGTGMCPTKAA